MNTTQDTAAQAKKKRFYVRAGLFCAMLALALIGMGLNMSLEKGGWEFWIFLLAFYGGVSLFWAWQQAKQKREPIIKMIASQVLHWSSVLAILLILVLFEHTEIINRDAASNVALLVLALACILAGVHFEWTFLLIGIVLAFMAIAISFLEQYVVWLLMVPTIFAAGWIFLQVHKRRSNAQGSLEKTRDS